MHFKVMTELKTLICGAGIAGNALAYWLAQQRHDVTVIERHADLRSTGLQIDIRGHGIEVLANGTRACLPLHVSKRERAAVREQHRNVIANFPANTTGTGLQSFTTDYEIMRVDLIRLLYDRN